MEDKALKILAFEYLIDGFVKWHQQVRPKVSVESTFTKLKLIKLLFFVSAVDSERPSKGLLDIFHKFSALPFGHVESDVYDFLRLCSKYSVSKEGLSYNVVNDNYFDAINPYKERLNEAIEALKNKNLELVAYSASSLVELSHQWYSWKSTFALARSMNKYSLPIKTDTIRNESKIFRLNDAL
ncbi:hypothetical protein [Dyadobacter sp. OTU695]|uniref:hypothetical protein n=1 Tax=Dyadobacter sp. OTU695 TaxID=3043860 RepID=UPI00313D6477